ncbi:MAG TPA: class I SAM-dependent methyltransferase [Cyclobacteriaceae bacterium]|nr:class I SAM-dependent methyltransferase [Cyclobacteriaceae bacterium]
MSRFFQAKAFINHWLDSVEEHSLHSPFFFDFYDKVVKGTDAKDDFSDLEEVRSKLLANQSMIKVDDFGSGSAIKSLQGNERKIADIAAASLTPAHLAQMYYRMCEYTEVHTVVELGTSMGLTSLYLSELPDIKVHTFEGSHALANIALTNFEYFEKKNINLIEGDISTTLPRYLQDNLAKIGFALVDANHRYAPTIQYFEWLMKRFNEKSIMVIDDIHHSPEMEKAWNELKKHYLVYGSVDLFRCGILFFEPGLNRQHFVWAF